MIIVFPSPLARALGFAIQLLILLIIVEVIGSYLIMFGFLKATHPMVRLVRTIVNPILNPLRALIPPRMTNGWDFSPVIAILLLQFLAGFISCW